ncbi:hypothetical protein B7Z17_05350 [Candidatus Saccharibacteria bacterium 32-49-10]|nr:MAG: hypothetical protein B7Z17_05350 [Candidatus Saccharibacteria bacterium 32-49-10]
MSNVIHNPALANIEEHSSTSATFVVEPLHAGYGNTLGNSLRRVLLSSIRGGAIVAFRVDGATHEFTTIPGVKEDVVDIMLNLKNVRVKSLQVILKLLLTLRSSTQNKLSLLSTILRNPSSSTSSLKQDAATELSKSQAKSVFTAI